MSTDASELRALARDLGRAGYRTAPAVKAVVEKAALNVKEGMRADLEASKWFKPAALDVTYDIVETDDAVEAIIGPVVGGSAKYAGPLASIAYFGGAKGGGGKVRDPQKVLDEEEPRFNEWIDKVLDDTLGDLT